MAQIGPQPQSIAGISKIAGAEIIFRGLAGFICGAIASALTVLGLAYGGHLIRPETGWSINHPLLIFALLASSFFISLLSNLLACFLIGKTNSMKYASIKPAIYQVLVVNVALFILMVPIYFIARSFSTELIAYLIAIYWVFAILVTSVIFEFTATKNTRNNLLSLYQSFLGSFVAIIVLLIVFALANLQESPTLLVAIVPALTWTIIPFFGAILEFLYARIYRAFGVDFLDIEVYSNK